MTIHELDQLCEVALFKYDYTTDVRDCPELLSALVTAIAPANMAGAEAGAGGSREATEKRVGAAGGRKPISKRESTKTWLKQLDLLQKKALAKRTKYLQEVNLSTQI